MALKDVDTSGWIAGELKFEEALAPSLETSIRITADGLSFFAFHRDLPEKSRVATIGFDSPDWLEGLKSVFFSHSVLSLPYRSTKLFVDGGAGYVVIPTDLKPLGIVEDWVEPSLRTARKQVYTVPLTDLSARIETVVRGGVYDFCRRSFPIPHFDHLQRVLISSAMRYTRRIDASVVMVIWSQGYVDVTVSASGQLLFANRFDTPQVLDVLYYVTAVWRQFDLDPTKDHLRVYASPDTKDEEWLMEKLGQSIKHLGFNDYPGLLLAPQQLSKISSLLPPEFILDTLCE